MSADDEDRVILSLTCELHTPTLAWQQYNWQSYKCICFGTTRCVRKML